MEGKDHSGHTTHPTKNSAAKMKKETQQRAKREDPYITSPDEEAEEEELSGEESFRGPLGAGL